VTCRSLDRNHLPLRNAQNVPVICAPTTLAGLARRRPSGKRLERERRRDSNSELKPSTIVVDDGGDRDAERVFQAAP
jgi:hypothetical protein